MELLEAHTHSFTIRIWMEPTDGEATWRGHITHALSGKRRYVQNLDEIALFIAPYLAESSVERRRPGGD